MANSTIKNLLIKAGFIKNEVLPSANTQVRIGTMFQDIIDSLPGEYDPVQTYAAGAWVIYQGQLLKVFSPTLTNQSPATNPEKYIDFTAKTSNDLASTTQNYVVRQQALVSYVTERINSVVGAGGNVPLASVDVAGLVKTASDEVAATGQDNSTYITPKQLRENVTTILRAILPDFVPTWQQTTSIPNGNTTDNPIFITNKLTTDYLQVVKPLNSISGTPPLTLDSLGNLKFLDLVLTGTTPSGESITLIEIRCKDAGSTPVLAPVAPVLADRVLIAGQYYEEILPEFTNVTTGTYSVPNPPSGLVFDPATRRLFGNVIADSTVNQRRGMTYVLTQDGVTYDATQYFTIAGPTTNQALQILPPTYNCTTGEGVLQTQYGDGTLVTWSIPGIASGFTSRNFTIASQVRNDPNAQPLQIRGLQSGITTPVFFFDFKAFCATATGTAPTQPNVNAPAAKVGIYYTYTLPEWGNNEGRTTYGVSGLPAGLSVGTDGRTITGTPTTATLTSITYTANKEGRAYPMTVSFTVDSAAPAISKASLRFYEGNFQGTPQSGGAWAAHLIKLATINQPPGTVPQVGVQYNGAGEIFWFNTTTLTGDSTYSYQESHSVETFANGSTLSYYGRINSAGTTVFLASRSVGNNSTDKADRTVLYDTGAGSYSQSGPDYFV